MESGVNAGSGIPCSYPQSWGTVPMLHYGVRRSVLVSLDLEVRVCFQQSLLHCPKEPSADSLIPSNQSTTFIQTFISCHLDPKIYLITVQEIAVSKQGRQAMPLSTAMTHTYWTAPARFHETAGGEELTRRIFRLIKHIPKSQELLRRLICITIGCISAL